MLPNMKYDYQDYVAVKNTGRLDDNESVFFAQQLRYVKSQTYDIKRVGLSALSLMPVSTSTPEGATTISYRQWDSVGMAKIIANYANDLPRADVLGKEFISPIRTIGNAYGYNTQEIRSALFAGINLSGKKAMAAVRAQEEKINQLAFFLDKVFFIFYDKDRCCLRILFINCFTYYSFFYKSFQNKTHK